MTLTSLVAALAPLAFHGPLALGPAVDPATDPASGSTSGLVAAESGPTATAEYFLISEEVAGTDDSEGAPIAVVALRSIDHSGGDLSKGARPEDVHFLLEREVIFASGGLRVRHTESGAGSARRLVWREFLPKESRTWVADWTAGLRGAPAHSLGYGWNRPMHEQVMEGDAADSTLYGPLELLYGTRAGSLPCGEASGTVGMIDPATASIVQVERAEVPSTDTVAGVALDLRRPDGSLVMGADMVTAAPEGSTVSSAPEAGTFTALRMSDRPTVAERIGRAEFDRLSRRWTVESQRPYDAVLARIPRRR